jgi:hypothetical protein
MSRRRFAATLLLMFAVAIATAPVVLAKDNAVARLDAPLPPDAEPGSAITVGWTVEVPVTNGSPAPFNGDSMFIRLVPTSGEPVEVVGAQDRIGHYVATVTVPAGGVQNVEFGLRGESCSNGTCERSDLMFVVAEGAVAPDPAVVVDAAPQAQEPVAGQAPTDVATTPSLDLPILLAVLATIAVIAGIGATMARGRRLQPGPTR